MRMRYLAAGLVTAGGVSAGAFILAGNWAEESVPLALVTAGLWAPEPVAPPPPAVAPATDLAVVRADTVPDFKPMARPTTVMAEISMPTIEPPLRTWEREIASGETLDAVLTEAGLVASDRAEVALALGAEYDLRQLRPGHGLTIVSTPEGAPRRVMLDVEDGVRIEADFGARVSTRTVFPEPVLLTLAGEVRIESSVFAALDTAGMPARFAVDLAQMLGDTVDFRRDLSGDETLRLMWREARIGDDVIGQPDLTFAALDLGDTMFEIVWPEDGSGRATIFRDGKVMRVFAQPVEGARLSSVFGRRTHPVYGDTRMHTGVDFAAAHGTLVHSTAPGRVSFIGWRGGYGRTVEIAHGSETMTRYAHLSAVPEGLSEGDRVAAGDVIGNVGATGTATGPNLHYEVRVDGRPTDPLSDERLAEAAEHDAETDVALARLSDARAMLEEQLAGALAASTNERL